MTTEDSKRALEALDGKTLTELAGINVESSNR